MITLHSRIARKETGFLISELGNEMVMMNLKTGHYIGLNETTTDIWKFIEKPVAVEDIITWLVSLYEVDRPTCEDQTMSCLNKMLTQELIQSE